MSQTPNSSIKVFSPIQLGPYALKNRMAMAPMTRNRAGPGNVPQPLNAEYYKQRASAALAGGLADMISFGVLFLANPDLPERYARWAPLNKPDPPAFYGGDEHGYTDYPFLSQEVR